MSNWLFTQQMLPLIVVELETMPSQWFTDDEVDHA